MRADRLISILMILQSRGRMTAQALAVELEVSERTIYRDINALCYAGVPIYTERGPGGGISLVERYRSDLTGLTKDEVRALFMINIPTTLMELGVDQEFKTALRKLSAALPGTLQGDQQRVRQRIHLDTASWKQGDLREPPLYLHALQNAVWKYLEVEIDYHTIIPMGIEAIRSVVWPYGLVAKAEHWYLVAQRRDHILVLRIDRIQDVRETGEIFTRPGNFDLVRFWESWCQELDSNRPSYPVLLRVSPEVFGKLGYFFGDRYQTQSGPEDDGWYRIKIQFEYHEQARRRLLGFGGAIEVLDPISLRYSLRDYAEQILAVYDKVKK